MTKITEKRNASPEAALPNHSSVVACVPPDHQQVIEQARNGLHRLIDQQLRVQESSVTSALSGLSQTALATRSGPVGACAIDSQIRKVLAQKLAADNAAKSDRYATSLPHVRISEASSPDQSDALYELRLPATAKAAGGNDDVAPQVVLRTRAEIELHLLCESSFHLAAGTTHVEERNDVLTLRDLMPTTRNSKTPSPSALLPASPSVQKKRSVSTPQSVVSEKKRALEQSVSASPIAPVQTIPLEASSPTTLPASEQTSATTATATPRPIVAAPPSSASMQPVTSQALIDRASIIVPNTSTYIATELSTDIDDLMEQIFATRTEVPISSHQFNCAWRCAWAMILTQQEPHALEQRLIDLLGDEFLPHAAAVKAICADVRRHGLNAILSEGHTAPSRLAYPSGESGMEDLLNHLATEVLQKKGKTAAEAYAFFRPDVMAPAEDIQLLVSTLGASCCVLQYAESSTSGTRSISLRPKDDIPIESLNASSTGDIASTNFAVAIDALPVALISHDHFDLLIPPSQLDGARDA